MGVVSNFIWDGWFMYVSVSRIPSAFTYKQKKWLYLVDTKVSHTTVNTNLLSRATWILKRTFHRKHKLGLIHVISQTNSPMWQQQQMSRNYFGIFKDMIRGYQIQNIWINYFEMWDTGYLTIPVVSASDAPLPLPRPPRPRPLDRPPLGRRGYPARPLPESESPEPQSSDGAALQSGAAQSSQAGVSMLSVTTGNGASPQSSKGAPHESSAESPEWMKKTWLWYVDNSMEQLRIVSPVLYTRDDMTTNYPILRSILAG